MKSIIRECSKLEEYMYGLSGINKAIISHRKWTPRPRLTTNWFFQVWMLWAPPERMAPPSWQKACTHSFMLIDVWWAGSFKHLIENLKIRTIVFCFIEHGLWALSEVVRKLWHRRHPNNIPDRRGCRPAPLSLQQTLQNSHVYVSVKFLSVTKLSLKTFEVFQIWTYICSNVSQQ